MSIDTLILLRTSFSPAQIKEVLLHDPTLTNLLLMEYGSQGGLISDLVSVDIRPWEDDDHDLIEDGFETATVAITTIPGRGSAARKAEQCVIAAMMRLVPGDVCLASQDSAGPDLLRLNGVVYINPDGYSREHLSDFGYNPEQIVVGIPTKTIQATAQ